MSYKFKKKSQPFVMLTWKLIDSPAWEELSSAAKVAYIYLKRGIQSASQKEIVLTYERMERIMDRHTYSRVLRELEEAQFVTREQRGGLMRKKNIFVLTEGWKTERKKG